MPKRRACDVCEAIVEEHGHYIVRMDVYADPSIPATTSEELEETYTGETIKNLIEQMKHMTADDLQDQVHRRFEFILCPKCHREFLVNPLGLPRKKRPATN